MAGRSFQSFGRAALLSVALIAGTAKAGVLPDDRADVLYHRYDGGGITIQGPSLLVRKKFLEKFSVSANYYVDMVSSASIDVQVLGASEYKEKRKQYSFTADTIRGKTSYSLGYTNSKENDYQAHTASFGLSQDMFGDLTTVSLGFSRGWDTVQQNVAGQIDPNFKKRTDRRQYQVGLSQIVTKNLLMGASFETITDEGFLNNPYRQVRYLDPSDPSRRLFQFERYPHTHTSNAFSVNSSYYLPYRAAVRGFYRFFSDTWGINAHTAEIGYTHPWRDKWIFEAMYRYYTQSHADFYSDLFPRENFQNFLARDKEMSSFNSNTIGVGVSYEFPGGKPRFVQKGTLNLRVDHIMFSYDDFRDARALADGSFLQPGTEPLYSFNANVIQFFLSIWF